MSNINNACIRFVRGVSTNFLLTTVDSNTLYFLIGID